MARSTLLFSSFDLSVLQEAPQGTGPFGLVASGLVGDCFSLIVLREEGICPARSLHPID
jgi:hypothetical protein